VAPARKGGLGPPNLSRLKKFRNSIKLLAKGALSRVGQYAKMSSVSDFVRTSSKKSAPSQCCNFALSCNSQRMQGVTMTAARVRNKSRNRADRHSQQKGASGKSNANSHCICGSPQRAATRANSLPSTRVTSQRFLRNASRTLAILATLWLP
jgi:hypothetical protein